MEINYNDKNELLNEIGVILKENSPQNTACTITDCPMSEKVIAYAFGELGTDEMSKIQQHLTGCLSCRSLEQDVRAADADSRTGPARPPELLPALSRAIENSKSPRRRKKWRISVPDLRPEALYPKILGTIAAACLALIIVDYSLQGPLNKNGLYEKMQEKTSTARKQISKPDHARRVAKKTTRPLKTRESIESITVRENSFIDPFQPPDAAAPQSSAVETGQRRRLPLTPLESLDLSQLKLVGTVLSTSGNKAMVEDATGRGYVLQEGTYVGRDAGRVTGILDERVTIEEEIENPGGRNFILTRELKLNKPYRPEQPVSPFDVSWPKLIQ